MALFEKGDKVYLAREIIEPACGDHPTFLMGEKGEQVEILERLEAGHYRVEGPTNPGKPWIAYVDELMFTKPMSFN